MKSHSRGDSRRRRAPIKRTPAELAQAHGDALLWQAILRAEAADQVIEVTGPAPAEEPSGRREEEAAQRARFAAAIARAEFGRFYFKDDRGKVAPRRTPARNGKGSG